MNNTKVNIKNLIYKIFMIFIICLGIFVRVKLYITKGVFEDDDCRLAIAMFDKHLWEMFLPLGAFSSTPTFLFFSKIVANITNYNEYALNIIPFCASLAGIIYFYKLTKQYFQKRISVIITNFLFAYNYHLISFSATFKQYSIEVLVTIMCLYYFPKIDICKMSKKQTIFFAVILAMLPLISLPSLFLIGVFVIMNIYAHLKDKVFYKKLILIFIPFIAVLIPYYLFNLAPIKIMQYSNYAHFWNNIYSESLISSFTSYLYYVSWPNPVLICHIILIILFFVAVCRKENRSDTDMYLTLFFIFIILAHMFHLYPIHGRTALYALPVMLLMYIKAFDSINKNKLFITLNSLIIFVGFICYLLPDYSTSIIVNTDKAFIKYSPKKMLSIIQKNFNPETDVIIVNEASAYCFLFYNKILKFNTNNYIGLEHKDGKISKEYDFEQLNNLDPNKHYWFYLIKEFIEAPERVYVQEWLEKQNVKSVDKEYTSYLYYVIPPYKKVDYK